MIVDAPTLTSLTLRRVTVDDEPFLRALYASTREQELAIVPWSEEHKAAFLTMQFDAQDHHYRTHYPDAQFDVIEVEGVRAGRLYLSTTAQESRIIDIAIAPEHRNRGIGTSLIQTILRNASEAGRVVTIHVELDNQARRLYDRLGFEPVEQHGAYLLMKWAPEDRSR